MITMWVNLDQPVEETRHMPWLSVPWTANRLPDAWAKPIQNHSQPTKGPQMHERAWRRSAEPCPVQKRVFQPWHYWHLGSDNSLFQGCSAHYRVFSSIPCFHPLNASNVAVTVIKSKNIFRHGHVPLKGQNHPQLRTTDPEKTPDKIMSKLNSWCFKPFSFEVVC